MRSNQLHLPACPTPLGKLQPGLWFGAMRLRRRKVAERNEVTRLLDEMETMKD